MFVAISSRYNLCGKNEVFSISKCFKDIFDKLGVTLIPISQTCNMDTLVDMCSALILTGSAIHVNPSLYHQDNLINYERPYDGEDELDYLLIEKFSKKNKPILGICRGIQVLNVYYGGTLNQKVLNHEGVMHEDIVYDNTFISSFKPHSIEVNSTHTQAIDKVAPSFKVSVKSSDGIIEGIEKDNIIGVQWHPEKLNDITFFENFLSLTGEYKKDKFN